MENSAFDTLTQPEATVFSDAPAQEPERETPAESSPENVEKPTGPAEDEVEEVPKDLDDKPLHKDSRFKRVIEERNRLREEKEALLAEREAERSQLTRPQSNQQATKPAWFTRYFGEDEEAWKGFQDMTSAAKEQAKQEALQELASRETTEKEAMRQASEWVDEQVELLAESGEKFDRNSLLKVMDEYRPTDDDGNLDFRKGLELLKLKTPQKSMDARKKLADSLNHKGGKVEPQPRDYVTAADLRKLRNRGEL